MPGGGTLAIETASVESDAEDPLGPPGAGRWVRLSVMDTGPGIDADARQHIFEPFFSTREESGGTGQPQAGTSETMR